MRRNKNGIPQPNQKKSFCLPVSKITVMRGSKVRLFELFGDLLKGARVIEGRKSLMTSKKKTRVSER